MKSIYKIPGFVEAAGIEQDVYQKWVSNKASTHHDRDKKYWKDNIDFKFKIKQYRDEIHKAVMKSDGKDFYTGDELDWKYIGKFGKKVDGIHYNKKMLVNLPTLDHYDRSKPNLNFVITGWGVNDAKNDLAYDDLLNLCKKILDHQDKCIKQIVNFQQV